MNYFQKNEESKENNFSKSYRTTKEMEKEKVENRVFSLFVNSLGALTIYGSTKLYKNKTKRFGDDLKFKYEEDLEK